MKGYRFLGVRGNGSARRKPTKAFMESANQIHIQPLASCNGERTVFENKPTRLATGVVCHPDTGQNRPYKIPWPYRGLNRELTAPQARTLPVCHTANLVWGLITGQRIIHQISYRISQINYGSVLYFLRNALWLLNLVRRPDLDQCEHMIWVKGHTGVVSRYLKVNCFKNAICGKHTGKQEFNVFFKNIFDKFYL